MKTLTIPFPDDWHCHLRDQSFLSRTVSDESKRFRRAIIMPNLSTPITTVAAAREYQRRILNVLPPTHSFQPLMTLYLTENIDVSEIITGKQTGIIHACKLYPAGATTHAHHGIRDLKKSYHLFEVMQKYDVPLLIHGEVVDPNVDILNSESEFIDKEFIALIQHFPELRIVLEHISTAKAVDFIKAAPPRVVATITPHHLLLNLNDLLANGLQPHYYCKPVVKQINDQHALIHAATSGNAKFFLGTDSAPHSRRTKECAHGCAGIYSAHAAIELYAELFSTHHALDKLAGFASHFGAQFYRLPVNNEILTLKHAPWSVPETLTLGDEELVPFFAGKTLQWQIAYEP
ncbi:MAG: dihydroorotase [Coxiella sp. RIFCSPHIGHO2_12_FULL_42_15]|nr:MAG: dihydroorotase [Coxiella sp. RIFCSPHIGHO2_12_FULL_42_15]